MDVEKFREYCLSKKGVSEELPFGPDTLVFKVMGKMFALCPLDSPDYRISLKNTPEKNIDLRAENPAIQGAFHMNKSHWNMLIMEMGISSLLLVELTDDSYNLVVSGLTKKVKEELNQL